MNILNDVSNSIQDPSQVYHDRSLYGKGTKKSPLKVAATALLPDQAGHSGEFLTTDGTTASWAPNATGIADADYGDITVSGSGAVWTVDAVAASALPSQVSFDSTPNADVTATGITAQFTANENQGFGDAVRIASDGDAAIADASVVATSYAIGLCTATVTTGNTGTYLLQGFARNDAWNWTVGAPIFLSLTGTTTNTLTQTAPSATNEVVQILGVATHADRIYFNPSLAQVEHV